MVYEIREDEKSQIENNCIYLDSEDSDEKFAHSYA
jgi:hypothetical protein